MNVQFIREYQVIEFIMVQGKAHSYEDTGILHWTSRLREEIAELELMQSESNTLREQVRELVSNSFSLPSQRGY